MPAGSTPGLAPQVTPPPEPQAADEAPALPLRRRLLHMAVVDVLILAELTAAVYLAKRHQEIFTLVFLAVFFGTLIPTLLFSRILLRRMTAAFRSAASARPR